MKRFVEFFSNKIAGAAALTLFIFLSALSGANAQNINNDLQPKKTGAAPSKTPPRQKTNQSPRTRTNNRRKQTRTTPASVKPQPTPTVPASQPVAPPQNVAEKTVAPPQPVAPPPTPQEVLERFMNFQQSASVTSKDWESVVSQVNAALQAYPNDTAAKAQLFVAQGYLAFNQNDYSNALIQFNAAAQVLPASALPFYSIGRVYLITKQPRDAEKAFEKAVKIKKDFALAYKGLGDAAAAQGKTKKAQEYYKEAAQVGLVEGKTGATNSSPANNTTGDNSGNVQSDSLNASLPAQSSPYEAGLKNARSLTAGKKWQNSLDVLMPMTKDSPTADLYVAIGDNYFGMRQWLSAQQSYRKATEIDPRSALAFYKSGMVLFELNEYEAAAESFEKALIFDQEGKTINRPQTRKMADRAKEKAEEMKKGNKRGFFGL